MSILGTLHFHSSCLQNKELAYSMVSDILSVTTHGDEETHDMNSIFRVDSGGAVVVNQDISYQNYRYFQFDVSYVFIHILYVCSPVCMCMYVLYIHKQSSSHMAIVRNCCKSTLVDGLFVCCCCCLLGQGH